MGDKEGEDTIHLKVKSQENDEVFFKIKRSTQLGKLMQKYCERQGITNVQNVRFLYDGERLLEKNTPNDLNMQNGDEIDVVVEQVGGCNSGNSRGQAEELKTCTDGESPQSPAAQSRLPRSLHSHSTAARAGQKISSLEQVGIAALSGQV